MCMHGGALFMILDLKLTFKLDTGEKIVYNYGTTFEITYTDKTVEYIFLKNHSQWSRIVKLNQVVRKHLDKILEKIDVTNKAL